MLTDPELKLGEAFTEGGLVVETGSIADLLALTMARSVAGERRLPLAPLLAVARRAVRRLDQANWRRRARANVHHHYDLDDRLYSLFLDPDRQYSCAYFETPGQSLEAAQFAKKRHIAAKLLVEPGQWVLDIGSGWGGLALYLAGVAGAKVRGITLSDHQFAIARERAADSGLGERIEFALEDYRDTEGRFDRIVSVGMLEHVGIGYLRAFFAKAFELLTEDGVCLIHAIGRSEGPGATNPWIAKYIFPGVYVPGLSELMPAVERAGFLVADIEILRLHYADTLKAWRERFLARRDEARRLYDERFCRMWEFYLASCEMAFRHHGLMVFQIQLVKREGVVPPTRRYIAEREARLSAAEREGRPQLRLAGT
ncbi:SAM-dependent methyltransferase [Blastochloris sulfoviridis]|uniref:Class I SAM-dependent methyltransferase n=1 Tax=Blastochloris sulfoviridis TaxID=50712 RepID=A0A5M6I461_9HYPH|nr:cyclopropane-fatty-acyl-phospholipid synthase family protein [Blastochloris sulfoviridis]KAA5602595.1 class I SAM-dependent methyltransferase [Blastochloris sulfoviridis]